MRYPAPEKLEIIRLVEGSHLPTRHTLDKLGIPRNTFYRWYDRYLAGGPEALEDRSPKPSRVWNRIPQPMREKITNLALREGEVRVNTDLCNKADSGHHQGQKRNHYSQNL